MRDLSNRLVRVPMMLATLALCACSSTPSAPADSESDTSAESHRPRHDGGAIADGGSTTRDGGSAVDSGARDSGTRDGGSGSVLDSGGGGGGGGVPGTGFIAYIGCSQSQLDVTGYQTLGGTRLEPYMTGGGAVRDWADPNSIYWDRFDAAIAGRTIEAAWFQICFHTTETTYTHVRTVLGMLQAKLPPGTTVYASGLEIFDPPTSCDRALPPVPELSRSYADMLAADGLAARGPDLGPITTAQTYDGCHPNEEGQLVTGAQLLAFFH